MQSFTALESKLTDASFEGSWPSVLVRPFENLTGDREKNYLGTGLATELALEIGRFQEIRVLLYDQWGHREASSDYGTRFVIDGNIREDRTGIKLTVYLTDTKTKQQIWGESHRSDLEAPKLMSFEQEVARVGAAKIVGEHGIIAKTLSYESRNRPPSELKTYEAILRFYQYDQTLVDAEPVGSHGGAGWVVQPGHRTDAASQTRWAAQPQRQPSWREHLRRAERKRLSGYELAERADQLEILDPWNGSLIPVL